MKIVSTALGLLSRSTQDFQMWADFKINPHVYVSIQYELNVPVLSCNLSSEMWDMIEALPLTLGSYVGRVLGEGWA